MCVCARTRVSACVRVYVCMCASVRPFDCVVMSVCTCVAVSLCTCEGCFTRVCVPMVGSGVEKHCWVSVRSFSPPFSFLPALLYSAPFPAFTPSRLFILPSSSLLLTSNPEQLSFSSCSLLAFQIIFPIHLDINTLNGSSRWLVGRYGSGL